MEPLFWIIDEEWADYDMEVALLREKYPNCQIKISGYEYMDDLESFGYKADAILCQIYTRIPAEVIERLSQCKAIAVYGGGYDRVDIEAARAKGIKVTNVSNYCKEDLADYTMAAVYFFYKELASIASRVTELPWGAQALSAPPTRISSCTMHIIGLGRIGREVAKKAIANGLRVTAYDPYVDAEDMLKCGVLKTEWDEGLMAADYISLNCICNQETVGMIKYDDFCKMKPTSFFINTARGQIVDEDAMARALDEGLIKGAMLDVIATEPPSYSEKIFTCRNAYITPHISYISMQSFEELKRRAVNNAFIGLEGGISPDLVNG